MLLVSFFSFLIVCILFLHECLIFLPFGIVEIFLLLITLVSHMVWCHSQVALQLLSEREKNDLSQLVSIMVSYSITYKNVNSDPLSINPRHEATSDRSLLILPSMTLLTSRFELITVYCVLYISEFQNYCLHIFS